VRRTPAAIAAICGFLALLTVTAAAQAAPGLDCAALRARLVRGGGGASGLLAIDGVSVRERDAALDARVDQACAALRARYGAGKSSEVPGTDDARTLYKALAIDPTKTRPSNEALLRRALKGEALYRINTLVDALNLVSLEEQLPFGLYDLDRVRPPVRLRMGAAGESYEGIRKGDVHVEGRPVLADALGAFGNPTSDSARSRITARGSRSSSSPLKAAWRTYPSRVQPPSSARITRTARRTRSSSCPAVMPVSTRPRPLNSTSTVGGRSPGW